MNSLSHEMSVRSPEAFKASLLNGLGTVSAFGVIAAEETGVTASRITLDTASWASATDGRNNIRLGTKPMDPATKAQLLFRDKQFTYTDEVSYRLVHELMHPLLARSQRDAKVEALTRAASSARYMSSGRIGLTALGSLSHYQGDKKVTEDATELLTMYVWSPDYLRDYTAFLANPTYEQTRRSLGIVSLSEGATLYTIIQQAAAAALA